MKITPVLLLLLSIPVFSLAQNFSDAENKLYNNYKNYAEIMWTLENDEPCVANQARFEVKEAAIHVFVKTTNFKMFPWEFMLFSDVVSDTLLNSHIVFFDGLMYKKGHYRLNYNEKNQIVSMNSDYVQKKNHYKNGDNLPAYYFKSRYDISYGDDKIQSISETWYIVKNPKKFTDAIPVVVQTIWLTYKTDSLIQKKRLEQRVDSDKLTLESPIEKVTDYEYFGDGSLQVSYYGPNGTVEIKTHTTYNWLQLPETIQKTFYHQDGDIKVEKENYTYTSEKKQATQTIERFNNEKFTGRVELDFIADTEYRFNAGNELVFEKKGGLFRTKDETTGAWTEWKDYRYCIN